MKHIIFLLILCTGLQAMAQEIDDSAGNETKKEYFKLYYIAPGAVGNNVLAKANKGELGTGIGVTLFAGGNFHGIIGYEYVNYRVTDISLAGNATDTRLGRVYGQLLYKTPMGYERLVLNPKFSMGYTNIKQRGVEAKNFGLQEGVSVSPGFDIDFIVEGPLRIYAGIDYILSFPETYTNSRYRSFYGTIQQLNFTFGIKL